MNITPIKFCSKWMDQRRKTGLIISRGRKLKKDKMEEETINQQQ
jgi:hypothetical protein